MSKYNGRNMKSDHTGHTHEGEVAVPAGAEEIIPKVAFSVGVIQDLKVINPLEIGGFDNDSLQVNGVATAAPDLGNAIQAGLLKGDVSIKNTGKKQAYLAIRANVVAPE